MNGYIAPIESVLDGYRFRSRLEARWYIFFKMLGWNPEYEKEGFNFGDEKYLPDFWVKTFNSFVEIKPMLKPEDPIFIRAMILHSLMNADVSPVRLWTIFGNPWPKDYEAYDPSGNYVEFLSCRRCNGVEWISNDGSSYGSIGEHTKQCHDGDAWPCDVHGKLESAFIAARQARFEHGEKPLQ
jgi:hypothetical protein